MTAHWRLGALPVFTVPMRCRPAGVSTRLRFMSSHSGAMVNARDVPVSGHALVSDDDPPVVPSRRLPLVSARNAVALMPVALKANPMTPAVHAGTPLVTAGHTVPHAAQYVGLVGRLASHPVAALRS